MDAALKLFVKKGIEETTTRDIAELAKAGEGTMFRHFKSKEELAWHLFRENLETFMKHLEESVAGQRTAKGKIRSMVEAGYNLYETDPILCTFLLLTEHSAARRMPENYKTPINLILTVIEEGQKKGEIKSINSSLAAALIFGAIIRVPVFKHAGHITGDLRKMVDEVTDACFKMVAA
ncbi:MAG TPA: TetR/AcrR family transcriptional regulator [bacterium]